MARLQAARTELVTARASASAPRAAAVDRARALLRTTTAMRLADGSTVAIDDSSLAARIDASDGGLDAAIADLAVLADLASRSTTVDLSGADGRLRQLVGEQRALGGQVSLIDALSRWLTRTLSGFGGTPPDERIMIVGAGGTGLALLVLVLAILGRDLRERFRREVVLPELAAEHGADPHEHLREAEDALRAGRARDAIRALYLYTLATLAAREAIRFDPSLTDHEVLARARAIPHADALRDLVELHECVAYGLRPARPEDAQRARALALQAVA